MRQAYVIDTQYQTVTTNALFVKYRAKARFHYLNDLKSHVLNVVLMPLRWVSMVALLTHISACAMHIWSETHAVGGVELIHSSIHFYRRCCSVCRLITPKKHVHICNIFKLHKVAVWLLSPWKFNKADGGCIKSLNSYLSQLEKQKL